MNSDFFEKNGFIVIKIPHHIRKAIEQEIKRICLSKLNFSKLSLREIKKEKFNQISTSVTNLTNDNFLKYFGHSAFRNFSAQVTNLINKWVKNFVPLVLKRREASLRYIAEHELNKNKYLKKKQYMAIFRVVRPNRNDVTFPHRDYDGEIPYYGCYKSPIRLKDRVKIWIPIWGCNKLSSLRLFKSSHLNKKIRIRYIKKERRKKPVVDNNFLKKNKSSIIQPIKDYKNSAILFHDRLVHFAAVNKGKNLRISAEFTVVTN